MVTPLTRCPFPAGRQGLRRDGNVRRYDQQCTDIDRESGGKPVKQVYRGIEVAPFYVADGRAIDSGVDSQVLLTDPALGASLPKVPGNARATIHGAQSINLQPSIPSDISVILFQGISGGIMPRIIRLLGTCLLLWQTEASIVQAQTLPPLDLGFPAFDENGYDDLSAPTLPLPASSSFDTELLGAASSGNSEDYYDGSNILEITENLLGDWSLGEQCTQNGNTLTFTRNKLADFANSTQNTLNLAFHRESCILEQPSIEDGYLEWVARCSGTYRNADVAAVFLDEMGELYIETPIVSGRLASCNGEWAEEPAPEVAYTDDLAGDTGSPPNSPPNSNSTQLPARNLPAIPVMPLVQRNAIARVYRDYCDPNFGAAYDLSGPMDQSLYDPYRNQLRTKYKSDCSGFFNFEVTKIIALRDLEKLLLPATGQARLDLDGAYMLGMWLFIAHSPDMEACVAQGIDRQKAVQDMPAAPLVPLGTLDSLGAIATGYADALALWNETQQQSRLPSCGGFLILAQLSMSYRHASSSNFVSK